LLLDGWSARAPGGAGVRFPWTEVAAHRHESRLPLHVAGGLTQDNVAAVVHLLAPAGVDVSSGVEAAPRHKAAHRLQAFVERARAAGAAAGPAGASGAAGRRS
jgi:phosphoribosylanthranilate isomerase